MTIFQDLLVVWKKCVLPLCYSFIPIRENNVLKVFLKEF
jgi:hypothetical protein